MKKVKLHQQITNYSCGPASLKMVLSHFDIEVDEEELIKLTDAKPGLGCVPDSIVKAAKSLGFSADYIANSSLTEIKGLMDEGAMVIVDWFSPEVNGHYSVVVELTDDTIILANPTHGENTIMSHSDFMNRWFELDEYPPKDPSKFFLREIVSIRRES